MKEVNSSEVNKTNGDIFDRINNLQSELNSLNIGLPEDHSTINETETTAKIKYVEENLWEKMARYGHKISFGKDISALFNYMRDPLVPLFRKALIVAALIYFISPVDAIPDFAPFIGFLDDLGVITALLKYLGSELIPYYPAKYSVT
jgi:uncharacterized membrane protein YkvA (DUF1232 family)